MSRGIWASIISCLIFVYLASYVGLSLTGGYRFMRSGTQAEGLSVPDAYFWQPRFGWFKSYVGENGSQAYKGSGAGYLYAPLILADQKWVHPTIFSREAPEGQLHPVELHIAKLRAQFWNENEQRLDHEGYNRAIEEFFGRSWFDHGH